MTAQVVFLIDTALDENIDISNYSLPNSICLACFRLLHFLSSHFEKRGCMKKSKIAHTAIKWGFKFFSSKTFRTKIETHKLKDFKLKYFEEFESQIKKRLESVDLKKTNNSVKPSQCLSTALTELLSDFQWERPDITSPVKGRRHQRDGQLCCNLVFLFTKCPKNSCHLKQYTGKQVPDADVFLDALLPSTLFTQFCHVTKLSLNWIDTQVLTSSVLETSNYLSVKIIENAISKTGGKVCHISAIVQTGCPYFVDVRKLIENTKETPSVKDKVLEDKESRFEDRKSCVGSLLPVTSSLVHLLSLNKGISVKKLTDDQRCTFEVAGTNLDVLLTPMFKTVSSPSPSGSKLPPHTQLSRKMTVYGVLPRKSLGMNVKPHCSYLCAPIIQEVQNKKTQYASSDGDLEALLVSLSKQECTLVLMCDSTVELAILEPLTLQTASLSFLDTGRSLCLEKTLMTQQSTRVTSLDTENNGTPSLDSLVERLVANIQPTKVDVCLSEMEPYRPLCTSQLERWYIPGASGTTSTLNSLITKLNLRIDKLDFLSKEETDVLIQLQRSYKQANKPPGLRETPVSVATVEPATTDTNKLELPLRGKKSRQSISRVDMIMMKSKAVVKERGQSEKDDDGKERQDRERPQVAGHLADFKNEAELKEYLSATYDRVVSGETTGVDSNVQMMVTVILHYMKQLAVQDPEQQSVRLIEECLMIPGSKLREKYLADTDHIEHKINEYEFQVVLRLEVLSCLVNKDQSIGEEDVNDEIVNLLRTLSFVLDSGLLSKFMQSCLLYNYMHTIPKTLANIYDELMQPLPESLANLLSPSNSSPDQSVLNASLVSMDGVGGPPSARTRSHNSVGPPSCQPGSNTSLVLDTSLGMQRGGRKLVHHPSMADFGAKRQIVVQKIVKPKDKSQKKRTKDSSKRPRDKVTKALFEKSGGGCKLERRQSVAVMERTHKTPKKHQHRSPRGSFMSPRRKIVAESPAQRSSPRLRIVPETPCHKQVGSVLRQAEEQQRRHSLATETTTEVIEESPTKEPSDIKNKKDTPSKGTRAKALLRRSFYSAGPIKRTRNLTHYFQLADKIAGRKKHPSGTNNINQLPKLLSFETPAEFKSPDKNSSFLLSQLVSSPSPAKVTPRKSTRTPSKLLADSPSLRTRSLSAFASSLNRSPGVTSLMSPSRRQVTARVISPATRLLQSPLSRRQSPSVFVPESETKNSGTTSHKTPEKSPICGVLSSGLDSPSQNTRQKVSATPTRKSVRAALFAKSPAVSRYNSPRTANASPRTLLSTFASPQKQAGKEFMSPRKGTLQERFENKIVRSSPRRRFDSENDKRSPSKVNVGAFGENIVVNSNIKNIMKGDENEVKQPNTVQKTPSPHKKVVTKTPDSFDKWHRRKPGSSQSSPAPSKSSQRAANINTQDLSEGVLTTGNWNVIEQPKGCFNKQLHDVALSRSPLRKKRSLLSPEKFQESPSKRRKTDVLKSRVSYVAGMGSQGFDVTGSFGDLSQASHASSVDYFSAVNDDVFLSQNDENVRSQDKYDNEDDNDIKTNKLPLFAKTSAQGRESLRNKTFERICSDYLPSESSERSESPIFGSSRKSNRVRNFSGDNIENGESQCSSENSCVDKSPNCIQSPPNKKYSPNVSAKSLMHLIQSPLLRSPVGGNKEGSDVSSPGKRGAKGISEKTRRSLKLHNF